MDHYCVLGNPVSHSKSPQIHARFAELSGQAMDYTAQHVALDAFAETVEAMPAQGFRGCNVTVPFKLEAFQLAAQRSARAELAEAANTLVFAAGGVLADNTDGAGLVHDIEVNLGLQLAGLDILLVGAGGAAAGVLGPLLLAGPKRLVMSNRTHDKAQAIVNRHLAHPSLQTVLRRSDLSACEQHQLTGHFDVVINATAASLGGSGVPVPDGVLKPGALAYDLMYGPAAQGFMDWATARGAQARDGLGMLVEQAAEAFLVWRGVRPSSAQVLQEMRAATQGSTP